MVRTRSIYNLGKGVFLFLRATLIDGLRIICYPRQSLKQIYGVSFFRNAVYLMMSSGINLITGFVFWILVARFYPVSEVGYGTTLLSAMALLAFIGTLGFGFGIIRYLPASDIKARLLNSSFTLSTLATMGASLIFLIGLSWWSPELIFIQQNSMFFAAFVVFTTASALHSMAQQTFMAFRRTGFTLFQNTIFGALRLVLTVVLASFFGAFGIFAASGLAFTVSLGICLLIFIPLILPRYRPLPSFKGQAGKEIITYSLANYASEGLWGLPSWILPIMILNVLGAEASAYYYMPWALASLLLAISLAISFSLFAEGSYEARSVSRDLKSGFKLIVLLLVPSAAILTAFGGKILLIFGAEYSAEGTQLLRLFTLAIFPVSFNLLYLGVARVEKRLKSLIWVNGVTAVATLVLSYITIDNLGIIGVGVRWLAAQTGVALFTTTKLIQKVYHPDS